MSCSEAGAGKREAGKGAHTEQGCGDDSGVMDWALLRPPNSKASRKRCQSLSPERASGPSPRLMERHDAYTLQWR